MFVATLTYRGEKLYANRHGQQPVRRRRTPVTTSRRDRAHLFETRAELERLPAYFEKHFRAEEVSAEEARLLRRIADTVGEERRVHQLVYADWLEERGECADAAAIRQ